MPEFELYRFKALGITSSKIPANTHLLMEHTDGTLVIVPTGDEQNIYQSTDKTSTWSAAAAGTDITDPIKAGAPDSANDDIWFLSDGSITGDIKFFVYHIDLHSLASGFILNVGYLGFDVFLYSGNYYPMYTHENGANLDLTFRKGTGASWSSDMGARGALTWDTSQVVVIGAYVWFLWKWSDENVELWKWQIDTANFTEMEDCGANTELPPINQRAIAYDGSNVLTFVLQDTGDSKYYLYTYVIDTDTLTKGAEYDIALMLDRNNSGTIPNESEKAFGISNEIVYEIATTKGGVLQLQDCSAIADANITAITDNFFMLVNGKMFEYTNMAPDINHLKVTEELGILSYADMDIKETTLGHFSAGDIIKIYDSDTVLSWRGRTLYPEMVLEGTEVIGKYVILGVDSIFDNIYRKNFTTVRSSDYILKNIIDNALSRLFSYDDEIDDFSALTFKYDQKSKARKTLKYLAMLERAVLHYKPDGELFFNKYNNLSPNPQIYLATYNFKDDADGTINNSITGLHTFSTTDTNGVVTIVASEDGHRKVCKISGDGDNATIISIYVGIETVTSEFIEFWVKYIDNGVGVLYLNFYNESMVLIGRSFINSSTNLVSSQYGNGAGGNTTVNTALASDTWMHVRWAFNVVTNKQALWLDGVNIFADQNFVSDAVATTFLRHRFLYQEGAGANALEGYFDAIGWSWDPSYDVGDNLNAWTQATSYVKITHYTPAGNRHITRAPVIGANNDLGQVYYVGSASESEEHRFGINELQPWRDPEITNYSEAKQLGDNLQEIYSLDTQMISMLVAKKKHIQVGYTVKLSWNILFNISLANFLVTKRVWYPITDISELELTDNILTRKAFNLKVINSFYDENAQEGYEHPDVPESAADGTVLPLKSIAELRAFDAFASSVGLTLFLHQDASADVAGYKLLDSLFPDDAKTEVFNATITADDQEIEQWVTVSGGIDVVFLHHGVYHLHGHGYKFSGTKDLRLYFKVYIRTAGGAETLIGTSEESSILPDAEAEIEVHTEIHEQALNLTDRIVIKIFAHLEGVGSNPVVYFYVEGNTLTRLSLPIDESSIKAYVDSLNSTINQILMSGSLGFVQSNSYGAAYTVAFSDVNARVYSTFYVGKGGSFKVSIIHSGDNNNFGKTAGGILYISYDIAGGLETWNIGAQDFNLPLEDIRYLKIEQFGTAFTVANNSKVGVLWAKDDNAEVANGTFAIYGMFLTRQ